ncbi:MAG: hypothetical protein ACMUJM_22180 [bacterium]
MGKFTKALIAHGHDVDVITTGNNGGWRIDNSYIWNIFNNNSNIIYLKSPLSTTKQKIKNFIIKINNMNPGASFWGLSALALAKKKHEINPYDFIVSRDVADKSLFVGWSLYKKYGVPWIAALNDPYPSSLYPPPYNNKKSKYMEFWREKIMRKTLSDATFVMFPSKRLLLYIEKKFGIKYKNNIILPHIGYSAKQRSLSIFEKKKLVILHAGRIHAGRSMDIFIRCFKKAIESYTSLILDVELRFLGKVKEYERKEIAKSEFADIVKFQSTVSYENSLEEMQNADALLLIEAVLQEGIFLPSKFCDYAISGKPLLLFSPKNGTIADIVGREHPGLLGQKEDDVVKGLKAFFNTVILRKGLDRYLCPDPKQFSEERTIDKFLEYITKYNHSPYHIACNNYMAINEAKFN